MQPAGGGGFSGLALPLATLAGYLRDECPACCTYHFVAPATPSRRQRKEERCATQLCAGPAAQELGEQEAGWQVAGRRPKSRQKQQAAAAAASPCTPPESKGEWAGTAGVTVLAGLHLDDESERPAPQSPAARAAVPLPSWMPLPPPGLQQEQLQRQQQQQQRSARLIRPPGFERLTVPPGFDPPAAVNEEPAPAAAGAVAVELECVVCLDACPSVVCIPCGHTCLCSSCLSTYQLSHSACPLW